MLNRLINKGLCRKWHSLWVVSLLAVSSVLFAESSLPKKATAEENRAIAQLLIAETALQRGHLPAALPAYINAATLTRDPDIAKRATQLAFSANALQHARQASHLWAIYAPTDPDAQIVASMVAIKAKHHPDAKKYLRQVLSLETDEPVLLLHLSRQLRLASEQHDFLTLLKALLKTTPNDHRILFMSALSARNTQQWQSAMHYIDRSLRLKPTWPRAVALRVQLLRQGKQLPRAIHYLKTTVNTAPDNHKLRWLLGQMLLENGKPKQAKPHFTQLLSHPVYASDAHVQLGRVALQQQRMRTAFNHLSQALRDKDQHNAAHYYLGYWHEKRKQPDVALQHYRDVTSSLYYLPAHIRIAVLLAERGELNQARQHLHQLQARTSDERIQLALAESQILQHAGKLDTAVHVLTQALQHDPQHTLLQQVRDALKAQLKHRYSQPTGHILN